MASDGIAGELYIKSLNFMIFFVSHIQKLSHEHGTLHIIIGKIYSLNLI